ncbi:MAG: ABC transporter permease, partial [Chloroflexota bacterium]|nr:ABC transporter permease [Chloroflexota bacterium]
MTASTPAALPRPDAAAVSRTRRRTRPPLSLSRVLLWIVVAVVLAYLVFPVFIVAPVSFSSAKYLQFPPPGWSLQWYENYLNRPGWVPATFVSIRVAIITTLLATTLGTAASLALVRGRFPGRNAINSFMVSPLVVPGIIVAIGIYFFYAQAKLVGNPLGLAFAHTALALPFVVTNVSA